MSRRALQQGESRTGTIKQGDRVVIISDGIATKGDRIEGVVGHFVGGSHQTVVLERDRAGYTYSGRTIDAEKKD
jgi:hypothetical protein